jgi:hypothetical protein
MKEKNINKQRCIFCIICVFILAIPISAANTNLAKASTTNNSGWELVGTYNINYRYNAAGAPSTPGGAYNPWYANYIPPGPYFINPSLTPLGHYKVVITTISGSGGNPAIWDGDSQGGTLTSINTANGVGYTLEFDHTTGQIVLYAIDWYPWDNSEQSWSNIQLWRQTAGVEITKPTASDTFSIAAEPEPAMPSINCEAKIIGITPDPTSTATFDWKATVDYNDNGRSDSQTFTSTTASGGPWTINFRNQFVGGTLTIAVSTVIDGKEYTDSVQCSIKGVNPDKQTVKDFLGNINLQVLCYKESRFNQFSPSGLGTPYFGPPSGFGLMQIDPPSSSKQIWNWQTNAQGGRSIWNDKLSVSRSHEQNVEKAAKDANPHLKVTKLTQDQLERQAAYLYIGAGPPVNGVYQFYYNLNINTGIWEQNPLANGPSVAYANDFMQIRSAVLNGNPPSDW